MANKDQPLKVELVGGLLTVSIGVSALCTAVKAAPCFETDLEGEPEITDEDIFVRAIVAELEREEEDGTTPLHQIFDHAAGKAIEEGAEGVRFPGDA